MEVRKGYIRDWTRRDAPEDYKFDYRFCECAEEAAKWERREIAERDCHDFNDGIEIPTADGGNYTIQNFVVEEFPPDRCVICCEAPFGYSERGSRTEY